MRPCQVESAARQLPPSPRLYAAARRFRTTEPKRRRRTQGGTVAATHCHRATSNTFKYHKRSGRMRRAVQNSIGAEPLPLPFRHENAKSRKGETAAEEREDRPSFAISDFRLFAIKNPLPRGERRMSQVSLRRPFVFVPRFRSLSRRRGKADGRILDRRRLHPFRIAVNARLCEIERPKTDFLRG